MKFFSDRDPRTDAAEKTGFSGREQRFRELKSGGSSFHSEQFKFQPDRITVEPTKATNIIFRIFFVISLCIFSGAIFSNEKIPCLIFGLFFFAFTFLIRYSLNRNSVEIDLKDKSLYPCGKKTGKENIISVPLNEAEYLYILKKECRGSKGSRFICYELNIAMKNGEHYNLLNHGGQTGIVQDARQLASILNLPLEETIGLPAAYRRKKSSAPAFFIIGTAFMLIGGIASYSLCFVPMRDFIACQSWKETPAVVGKAYIQSYRRSKGEDHHTLKFSYFYRFGEKQYESNRYDCFSSYLNDYNGFREIVRKNPPGKGILCYVNPADPSQAVVSKTFSIEILFPMLFVNLFLIAGIVLFCIGLVKRKRYLNQTLS